LLLKYEECCVQKVTLHKAVISPMGNKLSTEEIEYHQLHIPKWQTQIMTLHTTNNSKFF
jgi:hypothetical protein